MVKEQKCVCVGKKDQKVLKKKKGNKNEREEIKKSQNYKVNKNCLSMNQMSNLNQFHSDESLI